MTARLRASIAVQTRRACAGDHCDSLAYVAQPIRHAPKKLIAATFTQTPYLAIRFDLDRPFHDNDCCFTIEDNRVFARTGTWLVTLEEQLQLLVSSLAAENAKIGDPPGDDRKILRVIEKRVLL